MNRLGASTSPYLRQHADNPVDWYPWGDEAFAAARDRDRPVLLSIGYSSCHWCHVMAHESFEDPAVAAVMNRDFVNVKVDREERPDIDAIYMQAVLATTGRGGWPMTVFLSPDGRPFYAGTYFPPEDRHGMPGLPRVLAAIGAAWDEQRDELLGQAAQLHEAIDASLRLGDGPTSGSDPGPEILERAQEQFAASFDELLGGFGGAPKFPPSMTIDFLLERHVLGIETGADTAPSTGVRDPLTMATTTLDAMAAGGIYDQLGGGFHRYSVDARWLVPHFEKMLYDQALLVGAYLHAWLVTGEPRYRRVVEETIDYVVRDLRHPEGGFFSAEDADSEGVEGKFYVWSPEEITAICGDDAPAVVAFFGVTEGGNFEDPHTGFRGSILHVADRTAAPTPAVERGRAALLAARGRRVRPGLDDKILTAWNALFCRSLAEAASAFERDDWMELARTNASFLLRALRNDDGRLLRSFRGTRASDVLAYAEDHAALLHALVTLAEVDDVAWLDEARVVAAALDDLFADADQGGVFTTGRDAETLIVRPKDIQDGATPSENSLAAGARLRLAALTGATDHEAAAARWLRTTAPLLARHPQAFPALLGVVQRFLGPPLEVVVTGNPADPATVALWRETTRRLLPGAVKLRMAPGTDPHASPLLEQRSPVDGRPTAFVCERYVCRTPVDDPSALRAQLDEALTRR